jgi:hypothetical protein
LEKTNKKLDVYLAQAGNSLILAPDPEKIGKGDVVDLDPIDKGGKR